MPANAVPVPESGEITAGYTSALNVKDKDTHVAGQRWSCVCVRFLPSSIRAIYKMYPLLVVSAIGACVTAVTSCVLYNMKNRPATQTRKHVHLSSTERPPYATF